jgi:hypothetical protein
VRQLKALLEQAEARAEAAEKEQNRHSMSTPTKQTQLSSHGSSPAQAPHASSNSPSGCEPCTPQKYTSNPDIPPHPHDICDLDIQGAMQVSEDSPPASASGKHTEYAVHVKLWCGLSYSVSRRYNSFFALDQQLQKAFPGVMLPELPTRSLFLSSILDQMDIRCAALNTYVKVRSSRSSEPHVCTCRMTSSGPGPCAGSARHFLICAQIFRIRFGAAGPSHSATRSSACCMRLFGLMRMLHASVRVDADAACVCSG